MVKFLDALRDDLILFVRHSAWLNTAPERKDDKSKRRLRREEFCEDLGLVDLEMPDCEAEYLVAYFFEVGVPATHVEIAAWQSNTGIELDSWEARMLKQMSAEYESEKVTATEPDAPAPWDGAFYAKAARALVAKRVQDSILGMLK